MSTMQPSGTTQQDQATATIDLNQGRSGKASIRSTASGAAAPRLCAECGEPVVRRRVRAGHNLSLCLRCEQKSRASSYFQVYYAAHRERILEKNRRWAKNNATTLADRRRERAAQREVEQRRCIDCASPVSRAERCRRCHIRFRYANDPAYREHRLAITRRWLEKRS